MSIKNREEIRDLINKIEISYPVNEWIHNEYYLWPVLRINLYLSFAKQDEINSGTNASGKNRLKEVFKSVIGTSTSFLDYFKLKKNIKNIYCGAPSHRVNYQRQYINRYFDHLMDKKSANTLLVERNTSNKTNYYNPERVILVSDLLKYYRLDLKAGDFLGRQNKYAKKLGSILKKENFKVADYVSQATRYITNVDRAVFFFEKLLRKTNPENVYELCYYSSSLLGLNISAHRLGIKTIDVQHGPQGLQNLAYGSWHSVPEQGYEALPDEFHTWDISSANNIEQWTQKTTKHSATVTGNPWVEGWKNGDFESTDYPWPNNLILYTLQPIENPLEPYLLESIRKTCNQWDWWLRIHPRQKSELDNLKNILHQYDLLDKVNIDDASELLLPEILVHTKVHITKFSGCAIEAFSFGTPTIILDKRGESVFKDYFGYSIMSSCTENDSERLIKEIETNLK